MKTIPFAIYQNTTVGSPILSQNAKKATVDLFNSMGQLEGLCAPRGFFAVDYSPLESFLEQLVSAVLKTDAALGLLRDENAKLLQDRQETAELRKKLELLEKKVAVAEDKIKTKADQASVASIAQDVAASHVATAIQEVKNELFTLGKKRDTDFRSTMIRMNEIEEHIAQVQDAKADKTDKIEVESYSLAERFKPR